jgi:chromate reductase
MSRLLFVSGSLRGGSVNTAAIRAARRIAEARHDVLSTGYLQLSDFPFYNEDVERAGVPASIKRARALVHGAGAIIVSTPAYNGAPPGVLKNALDWLSRPAGASALKHKVVATMSASPGRRGGIDAQVLLRDLLHRCGCVLIDHAPLVAIGDAADRCSSRGELTDPATLAEIRDLVNATLATVARTVTQTRSTPTEGALV